MATTDINFKGISLAPSDDINLDGALSACENLELKNGTLRPAQVVGNDITLPQPYNSTDVSKLVAVHTLPNDGGKVFLFFNETRNIIEYSKKEDNQMSTINVGNKTLMVAKFYTFANIGQSCILSYRGTDDKDDRVFMLWRDDGYKVMQDSDINVDCTFNTMATIVEGNFYAENCYPNNPKNAIYNGISSPTFVEATEEQHDELRSYYTALSEAFVKAPQLSRNRNKFVFPFYVVAAIRLYDGTYAYFSEIQFMKTCPNDVTIPLVQGMTTANYDNKMQVFYSYAEHDLCVKINGKINETFKDLISSIDIFVTPEIKSCNNVDLYEGEARCVYEQNFKYATSQLAAGGITQCKVQSSYIGNAKLYNANGYYMVTLMDLNAETLLAFDYGVCAGDMDYYRTDVTRTSIANAYNRIKNRVLTSEVAVTDDNVVCRYELPTHKVKYEDEIKGFFKIASLSVSDWNENTGRYINMSVDEPTDKTPEPFMIRTLDALETNRSLSFSTVQEKIIPNGSFVYNNKINMFGVTSVTKINQDNKVQDIKAYVAIIQRDFSTSYTDAIGKQVTIKANVDEYKNNLADGYKYPSCYRTPYTAKDGLMVTAVLPDLIKYGEHYNRESITNKLFKGSCDLGFIYNAVMPYYINESFVCGSRKYNTTYYYKQKLNLKENDLLNVNIMTDPDISANHQLHFALCNEDYSNVRLLITHDLLSPLIPQDMVTERTTETTENVDEIRVTYPNKVYTTNTSNALSIDASGISTIGTTNIIGVSTTSKALSTGQFGAFPLICFTEDGVYALSVGSDGRYDGKQILSRDVCNNAKSITQLDNCVIFSCERGMMVVDGSSVLPMSAALDGSYFNASVKLNDKSLPVILDNVHDVFKSCSCVWDYSGDRVLVIPEGDYNNINKVQRLLSYSRGSESWTTINMFDKTKGHSANNIISAVNAYPAAYIQRISNNGQIRLTELSGKNYYDPAYTTPVDAYMITRPLHVGSMSLKKICRIALRGVLDSTSSTVTMIVYGSNDLLNWRKVAQFNAKKVRSVHGTSYKYYRFYLKLADLNNYEDIGGMSVSYDNRFDKKLR